MMSRMAVMLSLMLVFGVVAMAPADVPKTDKFWVFIGTGGGKAKGIYRCEFDASTGKLTDAELTAELENANFLAIHPSNRFLAAVCNATIDGKKTGAVSSYTLDPKTGKLTLVNQQPSNGAGPCHVVFDRAGKNVLIANYGGGNACCYPINNEGKLSPASGTVQHKGKSVNPQRQEGPHAHSINVDPGNRFAVVADLGLDQVLIYKLDPTKGTLTPNDPPHVETAPGAGPRHFAFHQTLPFAYVINELDSTITALEFDREKGSFKKLGTISTLPKDFKGNNSTAEVVVHPSGKFLYGSNRGHNSIAAFSIDQKTGELKLVGHQGEGIKTPRNFNIDPTGAYLLVGSQAGDNVAVFSIDQKTGELKPTGTKVEVPVPICIKFVPKAS